MAQKKVRYGQIAAYNVTPPTFSDLENGCLQIDVNGNLKTVGGTGSGSTTIQGTAADNAVAVGNPVLVGGFYNSSPPTYANGDVADLQVDVQGRLKTSGAPLDYTTDDVAVYSAGSETTFSVASTTNNDLFAATDVTAYRSFSLQLTGTWTGTIRVQGSNDNSNWVSIGNYIPNGTNAQANDLTGVGLYVGQVSTRYVRVRITTGGTGTVAGAFELFTVPFVTPAVNAQQAGTWTVQPGNTQNTTAWKVEQQYSYGRATADTQIKATAGFVHTLSIAPLTATPTAGLITLYDSAAESGTAVYSEWIFATDIGHTIKLDAIFATGIYVGFDATLANVQATVTYR